MLIDAFRLLDEEDPGEITPSDLVRLVKATTGLEIDMETARRKARELL